MTIEKYTQGDDGEVERDRFGFIRVRVSDDIGASGYVSAYMVDGTQITVRSEDLLRADDASDPSAAGGT